MEWENKSCKIALKSDLGGSWALFGGGLGDSWAPFGGSWTPLGYVFDVAWGGNWPSQSEFQEKFDSGWICGGFGKGSGRFLRGFGDGFGRVWEPFGCSRELLALFWLFALLFLACPCFLLHFVAFPWSQKLLQL